MRAGVNTDQPYESRVPDILHKIDYEDEGVRLRLLLLRLLLLRLLLLLRTSLSHGLQTAETAAPCDNTMVCSDKDAAQEPNGSCNDVKSAVCR